MESICVGQLLLGISSTLKCAVVPSVAPLEKTDFPLSISFQLQVASWLGVGPYIHSPFLYWNFCVVSIVCTGLMCSITISVSLHMYQFCYVWKVVFPWHHPPSIALIIFLPPLCHRSLTLEGRGLIKTSHLGLSAPNSLTLCTLSGCGSLC